MGSHRTLRLLDGDSDQRSAARTRVLLAAKLVTSARDYPVRIRDISATGARVDGIDLPAPGTLVEVQRGGFTTLAEVVWRENGLAGLLFDEEVEEERLFEVMHQRQSPRPAQEPHKRPGFGRDTHARWSNGSGWVDPGRGN